MSEFATPVPPPPERAYASPAEMLGKGVFESVKVGPVTITKDGRAGGGIWITGPGGGVVAIFNVEGQVGVGVYPAGYAGPCNCITVDRGGAGFIQLGGPGGRHTTLGFDDVVKLKALLEKEAP